MNFPMENPLFQFFYWMINTPGLGGIAAVVVGGISVLIYASAFRWIWAARGTSDETTYAYPTPALHEHAEHADADLGG